MSLQALKGPLVTPHFRLHTIEGLVSTLFLVEYPNKMLLFDSGCPCDIEPVAQFVSSSLKKKMTDLTLCFVSHAHPDHQGGAHRLREKFKTPIAGPHDIGVWYDGVGGWLQQQNDIMLAHLVSHVRGKGFRRLAFPREFDVDFRLHHGAQLPHFPDWSVVALPGHTSHQLGLVHALTRTAYMADLVILLKGQIQPPFPIHNRPAYLGSLERTTSLASHHLLLAHGGIFDGPQVREHFPRVQHAVAHAKLPQDTRPAMRYLLTPLSFLNAESRRESKFAVPPPAGGLTAQADT
mmetsp:Transcript_29385/g.73968  ORF Transcript_29385/g.73968 Transcript_29385/m.73968 type:complete len:292 (-) Transcript_29385:134-1009(-)|eukprot:CAMPEP_0177657976 /NCGR_PEP_ID=MMETSP0447-20121125/16538_1 /TAXON_ID=0 /ORGANISM="Stygamoeba regulata, Strain BSH-02190019" /LENGTH=291 /DNA_ID=CAMNT_0019162499 /DNA_START=149 /DNA_END=1024 /DNA_ORIENTATION=+